MRTSLPLIALAVALAGCNSILGISHHPVNADAGIVDASSVTNPDAAALPDASPVKDGAVTPDATPGADGGVPDAGLVTDGSPETGALADSGAPDSGFATDSGLPETGPTTDAGLEGGSPADSGCADPTLSPCVLGDASDTLLGFCCLSAE